MMQLIRDWVAIRHIEKRIGRPLTEEEQCGLKSVLMTTNDGVRTWVKVEVLPFKFFFPDGTGR